jgi:long-chain acyl-CoA synthetase
MRDYPDIDAELTKAGSPYEIETAAVAGRPTRVWKHAPQTLTALLEEGRRRGGDRDFIVFDDERISHAAHYRQVAALAHVLRDRYGVRPGDRVAIAMRNYPEWSTAFFAAAAAGGVAVALNAWWTGEELAFGVSDSESKVLIADDERLARLAPHLAELKLGGVISVRMAKAPDGAVRLEDLLAAETRTEVPAVAVHTDDPATLFYTSGTTSHPKGAVGSHRNVCSNMTSLQFSADRNALREGRAPTPPAPMSRLLCAPLFHATGCMMLLQNSVLMGGKLVFMHKWDPVKALELMAREGVTQFSGVPTMLWDLLNAPNMAEYDLSALKAVGSGGAIAPPELVRRVGEQLPGRGFSNGYGLTESSAMTTGIAGADYRAKPSSVGVPVPVCDLRIVSEAGEDLPSGERGEIWIRGPNVIQGYWRRPEATAAAFVDGWLKSGDVGWIDAEGFLYIVDRVKDIIIRGGENVSSAEVEAALYENPLVLEAAAIGVPHPTLGEEVGAVVRLQPGAEAGAEALRAHARERLAGFKIPTRFWFRTEPFPRNATDKILKRELRAEVLASLAPAG